MREPETGDFDDISFDSEDEDFQHEYEEIENQDFEAEFDTEDNHSQFAHLKDQNSTLQSHKGTVNPEQSHYSTP